MRTGKKCLIITVTIGSGWCLFLFVGWLFHGGDSGSVNVFYVGNGQFTNNGTIQIGPTFVVTNSTSKNLIVHFARVEVKSHENWARYSEPAQLVMVSPGGSAYATIEFAHEMYPTNSWRLRGKALERLGRIRSFFKAVRQAGLHRENWRRGNTGITSFITGTGYNPYFEVVSSIVQDPKSIQQ